VDDLESLGNFMDATIFKTLFQHADGYESDNLLILQKDELKDNTYVNVNTTKCKNRPAHHFQRQLRKVNNEGLYLADGVLIRQMRGYHGLNGLTTFDDNDFAPNALKEPGYTAAHGGTEWDFFDGNIGETLTVRNRLSLSVCRRKCVHRYYCARLLHNAL
jgi:hypothetical protein